MSNKPRHNVNGETNPLISVNGVANPPRSTPPAYWKTLLFAAPFSAAGIHFCWNRLSASEALSQLIKACETNPHPLTHIGIVDKFLCANTNFLYAALDPSNPPFAKGYLGSFTNCAFI